MTDQEQRTAHRRSGAGRRESDLMDVVHAADSGISMGWRWAQILVTILSAAFVAGTAWNGFDNMREEIKGLRADVAQVRVSQTATDKQNALDRKTSIDSTRKSQRCAASSISSATCARR